MVYGAGPMQGVLAALQDTPGSPDGWRHWLEEISAACNCTFAGFVRWDRGDDSTLELAIGLDESLFSRYHEYYAGVNPWILEGRSKFADGLVLPTEAFVPLGRLLRSEFYNDFARFCDVQHGVAAQIHSAGGTLHLSLLRPASRGAFATPELRSVQAPMPHLRAAVAADRYAAQLRATDIAIKESVDALPYGVIVLGARPFLNVRARCVLQAWPSVFSIAERTLRIAHPAADLALQRRIAHARRGSLAPDPPFVVRVKGDVAYQITVIGGFGGTNWASDRPPIVILKECYPARRMSTLLMNRYGLTSREAELVVGLYGSERLRDVADTLHISENTARLHLVRAFRKTGAHSQRELLAVVRSLAMRE